MDIELFLVVATPFFCRPVPGLSLCLAQTTKKVETGQSLEDL